MATVGLNLLQQAKLKTLIAGHKGQFKSGEIKKYSSRLNCTIETVRNFLPSDMQEADKFEDSKAFENNSVKEAFDIKNKELASCNEALDLRKIKIDELETLQKHKFTGKELWDEYAEAVGGKTFDDKPLPEYSKLGSQQKGWLAIVKLVNK